MDMYWTFTLLNHRKYRAVAYNSKVYSALIAFIVFLSIYYKCSIDILGNYFTFCILQDTLGIKDTNRKP